MKKIFFFLVFLFLPCLVSASSIKKLEVLNGTLSREFESTNNVYSILLEKGEERPIFSYELEDENTTVTESRTTMDGSSILQLEVTNDLNEKEIYTFYINLLEETTPVFHELNEKKTIQKEIPNLKYYVGGICIFIILILFKIVVLGFKKRKKN